VFVFDHTGIVAGRTTDASKKTRKKPLAVQARQEEPQLQGKGLLFKAN
jgi:hypothetical protein